VNENLLAIKRRQFTAPAESREPSGYAAGHLSDSFYHRNQSLLKVMATHFSTSHME
jgi:hypothetical protein